MFHIASCAFLAMFIFKASMVFVAIANRVSFSHYSLDVLLLVGEKADL